LWAAVVFFSRLASFYAFVLTVFVASLVAAQRPLGYDPYVTTYAMIYNRYGWALISILFVQLFVSAKYETERWKEFDAISAGLLLGIMFFVKISFLIVGFGAVLLSAFLNPPTFNRVVLLIISFLLVCLLIWSGLGVNLSDYMYDLETAWKVQSPHMRWIALKTSMKANLIHLVLCVAIWGLLALEPSRKALLKSYRATVVFGFTIASAFLLTVGDTGEGADVPFLLIASIILLSLCGWTELPSISAILRNRRLLLSNVIILAAFFGDIFFKDLESLVNAVWWHHYRTEGAPASQRFDAIPLQDFVVPDFSAWRTAYWRASQVPERINDGLALLREHTSDRDRIFALAYTDPFSFALGRLPPRKVPLFWVPYFSFSQKVYPQPDALFSDVTVVIVPILKSKDEGCCAEIQDALLSLYGDYLEAHFLEKAHSEYWRLLVKQPL
jgi:hypothetical protein